ncbi:hypothetical protein G7Z17_g13511 [Cylindrodendrum hubeiense]|uniref:SET domain-containing protein n=1 Tax=Cylindrodendrum hubeiense TaxID=595255 RepID=A0A9P5GVQ8_9HYPO|nr:hypothetical protein G7Z17_g13511 [Cylindrodendrum hubeiense]
MPQIAIPAPSLPQNHDAIYITNSSNRGRCVHAIQNFPSRHKIIVEQPAISCVHWRQGKWMRTIGDEWEKRSVEARLRLQQTFKKLEDIPSDTRLTKQERKQLNKFVKEYAFWDSKGTNAHIYRLASHINHACARHANAEQWTDSAYPNYITVRLVKDVRADEEIFINYNKGHMPFGCPFCVPRSDKPRAENKGNGSFG